MNKLNIKPQANFDLYLFGSSLYSEIPNDIDLAIIYDKEYVSIENAIKYRRNLEDELMKKFNCSIEILLLSRDEEAENEFLSNAKHEIIYKTTHNV